MKGRWIEEDEDVDDRTGDSTSYPSWIERLNFCLVVSVPLRQRIPTALGDTL